MSLTLEDLGGSVAVVWSELRPATRSLLERALQPANTTSTQTRNVPYDARADLELSRFLAALDDRVSEEGALLDSEKEKRLRMVANTCALVLEEKTQSAEVFAQLVRRAEMQRDYKRIDTLADALTTRFAASEICEIARADDLFVRELAHEALARFPTSVLLTLLGDPVDREVARQALRRQVVEYGSEEARQIVNSLD